MNYPSTLTLDISISNNFRNEQSVKANRTDMAVSAKSVHPLFKPIYGLTWPESSSVPNQINPWTDLAESSSVPIQINPWTDLAESSPVPIQIIYGLTWQSPAQSLFQTSLGITWQSLPG